MRDSRGAVSAEQVLGGVLEAVPAAQVAIGARQYRQRIGAIVTVPKKSLVTQVALCLGPERSLGSQVTRL